MSRYTGKVVLTLIVLWAFFKAVSCVVEVIAW